MVIYEKKYTHRRWCGIVSYCFLFFTFFFTTVCADNSMESAANIGFHLLEDPINPRVIAMGSAGVASAGAGFSFYNPALPFLVGKSFLSVEYGQYPAADLKRGHFEGAGYFNEWFFGMSFHTESIEDIFPVNMWGNLPGKQQPFSQQFTSVSFDIGYVQWEDFSLAVSFNAMQDRIEDEYAYAYTLSAGAVLKTFSDRLILGLSLLNLGVSTPMLGSDTKKTLGDGESIPMNSRIGASWTHQIKDFPYTIALDIVYRNVRDESKAFTRNLQDRFSVPVGIEVKPLPPLAIRMGKRFNHSTEVLNFGVGWNIDLLSVDASFVIPKLVDDNQIRWLTAITYYLRDKKEKTKNKSEPEGILTEPVQIKSHSPDQNIAPDTTIRPDTIQVQSDTVTGTLIIKPNPIDSHLSDTDSVPIDTLEFDSLEIGKGTISPDSGTVTIDDPIHKNAPKIEQKSEILSTQDEDIVPEDPDNSFLTDSIPSNVIIPNKNEFSDTTSTINGIGNKTPSGKNKTGDD